MVPSDRSDPLEPMLRDAEEELRRRLREACAAEAGDPSSESTEEIRRLEDSLLAAAAAAEHTLALRRQLDERGPPPGKGPRAAPAPSAPSAEQPPPANPGEPPTDEPVVRVREFRDVSGRLWRAWPVTPGSARGGKNSERYLGEFHKGWVCFESLDSSVRRRLPLQQPRWSELDDEELLRLLDQAISVPERRRRI